MKLIGQRRLRPSEGYSMALTLLFGAISLSVLGSALRWSTQSMRMNARSNQYFRTVAAAEAATESVITRLSTDYRTGGDALVQANLSSYRMIVPSTSESSYWSGYAFGNNLGNSNLTQVIYAPPMEYRELSSKYRGLNGYASSYQVASIAKELNSQFDFSAGVQQNVEAATIPLFQFAIFYNMDLEINPGPDMTISGPVHSNGNIYSQPQALLTFQNDVTAVGSIIHNKKPGDPSGRTPGTIVYNGEHDGGVNSLTLPVGTNNTAASVHQVVEVPPLSEPASSSLGKQRFYNQADLIIKVTDGGVTGTSGAIDNFGTTIPVTQLSKFVDTTVTFYNQRESATIKTTQIDVAKLRQWSATNTLLRPILPFTDVRIVYVLDERTQTASSEAGVRLVNGETLPPQGLTVVTPNPLYVKGHYNAPVAAQGTADTSQTLPAALIADAITVLSPNWSDANSSLGLDSRAATESTVNAAFMAGIVETVSGSYSGGVENFPRFLENWSGVEFTYNGSMVVMYPSSYATAPWSGTGSSIGIYNPPVRRWAFDTNFKNPAKLPPGTPSARVLIRASWLTLAPSFPL